MDFLLDNRLLKFTTSSKLDLAYRAGGLDVTMKQLDQEAQKLSEKPPDAHPESGASNETERMLLTQSNSRFLADQADVPELEEQVQRAVKQVEKALRAEKELQEEKQDLDSVNQAAEK